MTAFVYDDGGRAAAGYRGDTGDCVTRAIAIATQDDYQRVYAILHGLARDRGATGRKASPRNGVARKDYDRYLTAIGWTWTPTMGIGTGCTTHLTADELPSGRIIARLSRHLSAVIDGVVHDTFDPSRDGTRCVYGYWKEG